MAANYFRHWPDKIPVWMLKLILNIYGPFLGAGIRVKTIADGYKHIEVRMKLKWYNQNYVGTHFGGSLYSMTDPFYMLMLIKNLGHDYIVWDKAASIDFKKPGRSAVRAIFNFTEAEIQAIKQQADQNDKYVFDRQVDILDAENVVIATVVKTLYVRRKDKNSSHS